MFIEEKSSNSREASRSLLAESLDFRLLDSSKSTRSRLSPLLFSPGLIGLASGSSNGQCGSSPRLRGVYKKLGEVYSFYRSSLGITGERPLPEQALSAFSVTVIQGVSGDSGSS
jgi:hypothetical protein